MFARSCVALSSTDVNPKYCRIYGVVDDRASIVLPRRQRRIELRVPSVYNATNSVGEYSFVRAIISGCVAFSPVYSRLLTYVVYICIGALIVIVSLIYFCSYLLYMFVLLLKRETRGNYKNL